MISIIETIKKYSDKGEDLVLAVITERKGSAPRGVGAGLLAGTTGLLAGSVGGGALEAAVLRAAEESLAEKKSRALTFRLDGGKIVQDSGMVCGGEVSLWLQYIDAAQKRWTAVTDEALAAVKDGGSAYLRFDTASDSVTVAFRRPSGAEDGGVFYVPFEPPQRAIIFGGGHVAQALAPILKNVGFRVIVMDDRPEFATNERFPDAAQVVCGSFGYLSDLFTFGGNDYAVVVTSGHIHDYEVEEQILRHELAYIGVIGSRKKTAAVNAKLRAAGITGEQLAKVHTPIGLAIGAETPEEIAVSIAAEMIAVRAERRKE